jgi:hypothetical protein
MWVRMLTFAGVGGFRRLCVSWSRNGGQRLMAELGYLHENRIKEIISLICIHGLTERCRICGQYANAAMCVREMLISCRQ